MTRSRARQPPVDSSGDGSVGKLYGYHLIVDESSRPSRIAGVLIVSGVSTAPLKIGALYAVPDSQSIVLFG